MESVHSFVDAPFFVELSKYKLDHAKLSDAPIPVSGIASVPRVRGRVPAVRFVGESFNADTTLNPHDQPLVFRIDGSVRNTNTIEEFKDIDKKAMLQSAARQIGVFIANGDALKHPELLMQFEVLTFADLKRYRFFYWFLFPLLKWMSHTSILDDETEVDMKDCGAPIVALSDNNNILPLTDLDIHNCKLGVCDLGSTGELPCVLRNVAALLAYLEVKTAKVYIYRPSGASQWIELTPHATSLDGEGAEGWERNAANRLVPKLTDLSSLLDPLQLANQAVDLNLKLMKWRAAPQLDLTKLSSAKCLLLGAGTLGSYVARGLLAWGVRTIAFVDSGSVSFSNPVRQPLYTHEDCVAHAAKAETAANNLRLVFPGVTTSGIKLEIPMAGHGVVEEARQHAEHDRLRELIDGHDVVFLLMDSRESRWLPTVMCAALNKVVINVALGFDSYVVMRHGLNRQLGCYFCNDVVSPADSISRQTLDQMCTVTRPGCAMVASGYAIELLAQVLQHPDGALSPANAETILGPAAHQLRGFLSNQEVMKVWAPAFPSCSACGPAVELWKQEGWEFAKKAMESSEYLAEVSGLAELQRMTEDLDLDDEDENEDEGLI